MAAEILRPQDCLIQRIRVSPCHRRNYIYNSSHNYNYSSYFNYNTNQQPKYYDYSNTRPNRKPAVRSERTNQRKRQSEPPASASKRSNSADNLKISRNHNNHHYGNRGASQNLVMETVAILRRGESLDSKMKSMEMAVSAKKDRTGYMVVNGTDRLGPEPEMVPKHIKIAEFRSPITGKPDMYAGSGFAVSPAPSSLPLPSFWKKKQLTVDDSASRDLRRLLRLDF